MKKSLNKKKKLIAISGGVDSMTLAYFLRNNKNIVAAFVNYNIRNDTDKDQQIVENFCKKHNWILEKKIIPKNTKIEGNFENWARLVRYEFFKKIYDKYNCSEIIIAHHKDDFLETCLMQKNKNENKLYYGIKKVNYIYGMKINRPFLFKYWKQEIYEIANKNNINFNEDYTNKDEKYERNKIRNQLIKVSNKTKENELKKFLQINEKNKIIIKEIRNSYSNWKKEKFSIDYLFNLSPKFQEFLIIDFINKRRSNINLNKKIIENLLSFLKKQDNNDKKFLLSKNNFVVKKNKKILLI